MKRKWSLLIICCLPSLSFGETTLGTGLEVENPSHPLPLIVENLPFEAEYWGINQETVYSMVALRLRNNGIQTTGEKAEPYYLYININLLNGAANIAVSFSRLFIYEIQGEGESVQSYLMMGTTYNLMKLLRNSDNDKDHLFSNLFDFVDKFSIEYLKANQVPIDKDNSPPHK